MTDSYDSPFDSPKWLLDEARRKLDDLAALELEWSASGNYEYTDYIDNKRREKVICLSLKHRIPPQIRILAGSILNDLRHALDQAVCDAALMTGRPNSKGVYFPIGKSSADLESEIKRRCKHVHPDVVQFPEGIECLRGWESRSLFRSRPRRSE